MNILFLITFVTLIATILTLIVGLFNITYTQKPYISNYLMRTRVVLQAFTITMIIVIIMLSY